jgi:hypothetical protein
MSLTQINYPNHEHEKEDQAARRRALKCLDNLESGIVILRRRLTGTDSSVPVEGADAHNMAGMVLDLGVQLSALETLRGVREWDA